MNRIKVQDALAGIVVVTGLIGIGLLGLVFGSWLKPESQLAMTQHPLFNSGIECLTASAACSLLLLGSHSRRSTHRGGDGDPR